MPGEFSDKDHLKGFKKAKWVAILALSALVLTKIGDIVASLDKTFEVGNKVVSSIVVSDINAKSELITDSYSVFFVSSVDYGFSYGRINPFSEKDIQKALMNENLFVDARGGILVGLRVANTNGKILNVEEVRVNLESYEEIHEQDFYDYTYVYSGAANAYYDYYSVTLEPERRSYNALAYPPAFEYGLDNNLDSIAPAGKIYYPVQPGHSEFIALYITPKELGVYSFRLSIKYSIGGRDNEILTSQIFRIVNLPDKNTVEDIPPIKSPISPVLDNPFSMDSFPMVSCGDIKPQEISYYPLYMYPILIHNERDNLSRVRDEFCGDAYLTKRHPGMIQVASFHDREKGHHFSILMEKAFGYAETGPAYKFDSPGDREPEVILD